MRPFAPIQCTLEEAGSFERMIRRFIRRTRDDGVISEVMSRRGFRKPSQERRRRKKLPRG